MSEQSRMQTSSLVLYQAVACIYSMDMASSAIGLRLCILRPQCIFEFLFFLLCQMRMKNNYHITVLMLFVLLTAGVQQPLNIELTAICEFEPSLNLC